MNIESSLKPDNIASFENRSSFDIKFERNSFEDLLENIDRLKKMHHENITLFVSDIDGVKTKEKNFMHRMRIGLRDDKLFQINLERITTSKLAGARISKVCSLILSPENALIASNILHDMVKLIYRYNIIDEINASRKTGDYFRAKS